MAIFARKPRRPSQRLTDERLAAMALYSSRCRDALTQRLDVQTKAPESVWEAARARDPKERDFQ